MKIWVWRGMNASVGSRIPSKSGMSSGQSAWDGRGSSIRSQIKRLQEEVKSVSKDDQLSEEQKSKRTQALQREIQDLNSQLRKQQLEKRQEELQKKQEKTTPDTQKAKVQGTETQKAEAQGTETQKADKKGTAEGQKMFGSEQLGVIITISLSKDQVSYLKNMQKDLEKQQKAAGSEEEKDNIRHKIVFTEEGIKNTKKENKFGTGVILDGKKAEDTHTQPERKISLNQNDPFGNVSVVIR